MTLPSTLPLHLQHLWFRTPEFTSELKNEKVHLASCDTVIKGSAGTISRLLDSGLLPISTRSGILDGVKFGAVAAGLDTTEFMEASILYVLVSSWVLSRLANPDLQQRQGEPGTAQNLSMVITEGRGDCASRISHPQRQTGL